MSQKTFFDGDRILREYTYCRSTFSSFPFSAADCITYYYDEAGDVIELNYYGANYYYYKNIFGDVLGIMTSSGTMVVRYSYDAWGNILSITGTLANSLGKNNPFRYRSYYYDNETGWYYLKSRYYDPAICRFISPDDRMFTGEGADGLNLYAYCKNNPVNLSDPDGHIATEIIWEWFMTAGAVSPAGLAVAAGLLVSAAVIYAPREEISIALPAPKSKESIKELFPKIILPKTKAKEKAEAIPAQKPGDGPTYYHVTTFANAQAIMSSGILMGSAYEGGFVFAWRRLPDKYAIKNSGARSGSVILAFQTNASFVRDNGIEDPYITRFEPVVSFRPGPIRIKNAQIIGVVR